MKKAKWIALIIVVVMTMACLLTACQKKYTVTYYNGNEKIGEEKIADGGTASGKVAGWTLVGALKVMEKGKEDSELELYDLNAPVKSNLKLTGYWTKNETSTAGSVNNTYKVGGTVILGTITDPSGDFRWPGLGQGSVNASDQDVVKLTGGYGTMELNQGGNYVWNDTIIKSHTDEEITNGEGEDAYLTYRITMEIKPGIKLSGGTELKAKNYLAYVMSMSTPVVIQGVNYNREGYSLVGWNTFVRYDGTNAGETATKEFSGIRLLGDYKFSIEVNEDNYPYYYADILGAISAYDTKLLLGNDVDILDDGDGVYFTDNWYAKDGDTYTMAEHLKTARKDISTYEYTGPYTVSNWNASAKQATLKINPNYAGNFEGQKPHIDTIVIKAVVEATQFGQLSNGEVDILSGLTGADSVGQALTLVRGGNFAEVHYDRAGYGKLQFVCDFSPTMFAEVRQAVAYCLDRNDFANTFCGGYGAVTHGPYSVNFESYMDLEDQLEENLNPYAVSTTKAKQVLEAGGWIYNADGTPYSGTGVRYKKLAANEYGAENANLTYTSVENTDGVTYSTVKVGDDYYMPCVINWLSTEGSPVTELLTTKLLNGTNLTECGIVLRQTIGDFNLLLDELGREGESYSGSPRYGMCNLATGWSSAVYDNAYNWIDNSNEEMYEMFFPYSMNFLSDEYDAEFSWWEKQGLTFDEAWEQSGHKLGMNYLSMAMVYSVDPGDTEEYNKWFYQFMIRWNELMPDIPLYSNIYFDCYNSKILNFKTSPFFGAAEALLYCAVADAQ